MRRICVVESLTLDGVMQAPGGADEDRREDFRHGGWAVPYADAVQSEAVGARLLSAGVLLFGRRTFEQFAGCWPQRTDHPLSAVLAATPKVVVGRSLRAVPAWPDTRLLDGDLRSGIGALTAQDGGDVVVLGSGDLVRGLLRAGLVDELLLSIHPVVLGSGRRLFDDGAVLSRALLMDAVTTTTGVVVTTYHLDPVGRRPSAIVI